jgi:hypothetical protein
MVHHDNLEHLLSNSKKDRLKKAIKHNLQYYKQLKDILESHKTKHSNMLLRKKLLEQQNKLNHTLEYDRIRGLLLDNSLTHGHSRQLLKDRMKN